MAAETYRPTDGLSGLIAQAFRFLFWIVLGWYALIGMGVSMPGPLGLIARVVYAR